MTVWLFIEFDKDRNIVDVGSFGSLRMMVESKEIYIKGFKLPEGSIRKILKENGDYFSNEAYYILKTTLATKKHS